MRWNPEDYVKNSSAQLEWARELIRRLALTGSESVLDVGCGDGKITAEFADVLPAGRVLGVDSSPEFIAYAKAHYPHVRYPSLWFLEMHAERLSFEQSFEIIFSNAALHWVHDHPAFLKGCSELLSPEGRLILSCGGAGNAADVVTTLDSLTSSAGWNRYFDGFSFPYAFNSPADYAVWLPEAGLRATRCELVEKDMAHDSLEGLAGWIRTTWMPWTDRVPPADRERFIACFVDAYLDRFPLDRRGRSHVRMVRLEVEAIKTG